MVSATIFALHGIACVYAFFHWKKLGNTKDGILAVAFIVIIFTVGWTISTMVTSVVFPEEGLAEWLDADAIALVLLTVAEIVFYWLFLGGDRFKTGEPPTT